MLSLLNDYYKIDYCRPDDDDSTLFRINLLPGYCAYEGHFPGNPVSPGVCNIQLIKECAEWLAGRPLFLAFIDKCKFMAVISPQTTPYLQLRMYLSNSETTGSNVTYKYNVRATLFDDLTTYIEFKGEFVSTPITTLYGT